MATVSIDYRSCSRLCCGNLPAEIIICIPSDLTASGLGFIDATLSSESQIPNSCGNSSWQYTIQYDSTLVGDGVVLSGTEITGVICADSCFVEWVQGQITLSVQDTSSIDLTLSPTKVLSGVSKISADPGNGVSIHSDGLYAPNVSVVTPLFVSTTEGISGTSPANLISYTLPAGTLANDHDRLEVTIFGTAGASGTMTGTFVFGGSNFTIFSGITAALSPWNFTVIIIRNNAGPDQVTTLTGSMGTGNGTFYLLNNRVNFNENLASNLLIAFNGSSSVASNLVVSGMTVNKVAAP